VTIFITYCYTRVIFVSNNDNKVLNLNQYNTYQYEKIPNSKELDKVSNVFSYTVDTNETLSAYLFNKEQYKSWKEIIVTANNTNIKDKEDPSTFPSIEDIVNETDDIDHLSFCDCPTNTEKCEMKLCNINEDIFYLVVFGHSKQISYKITDVEGDYSLKDILSNGQSILPQNLNNNFIPGKAYKTSFIGLTENDNDNKEFDVNEENDIFKKMVYIAIIVIPSIIIFLLLLFIYCHRGVKIERKNKDDLYHSSQNSSKSLKFYPFKKSSTKSKSSKKKNPYSHFSDNSTLPNDNSKISANTSHTHSKGGSTLYGHSMENRASVDVSDSVSYNPYEEPFGGNYISKKLDAPINENLSTPANISIPYNKQHYSDVGVVDDDGMDDVPPNYYDIQPNPYYRNSNSISVSGIQNRSAGTTADRVILEEKSEDIVNTSIGHVEGEEFDNTKNIYIKINRSTNKYNTEEYLKEDSINKIREKHSCITQLSQFFNDNKDTAIVNDSSSSMTSTLTFSSSSENEEIEMVSHHKKQSTQQSSSHDLLLVSIPRKLPMKSDSALDKLSTNHEDNSMISLDDDIDDDVDRDNQSILSDLSLPSQAHVSKSREQKQEKSESYYTKPKSKNVSIHTFGNSINSPDSEETSPTLPTKYSNPNPNYTTSTTKYMSSSSNSHKTIIGRLIYTYYYSSTRILNVDEVVKIKKLYDNMWVKVERNPKEYFVIPLLVLEMSWEDLKELKKMAQRNRSKPGKEEKGDNERVEPNPEYLYNCAYISYKDFQKMKGNDKWANKLKSLNLYVSQQPNKSLITPSTSSYISSSSSSSNSSDVIPTPAPASAPAPPPSSKKSRTRYATSRRSKSNAKIDLEAFKDSTDKNISYTKIKSSHKKSYKSKTNNKKTENPFTDSSLEGMDINVSPSQDDIDIVSKDKTSKTEEEEFYHFENVSDPGMSIHSNTNSKKKDSN